MKNKYYQLDKTITSQVMKECKGLVVKSICPYCNDKCNKEPEQVNVYNCEYCGNTGFINYQY